MRVNLLNSAASPLARKGFISVADTSAMDEPATPIILTEDNAAAVLGLSARSLQRSRLEGHGPAFVRLTPSGGRIGYTMQALRDWIARRTVTNCTKS